MACNFIAKTSTLTVIKAATITVPQCTKKHVLYAHINVPRGALLPFQMQGK